MAWDTLSLTWSGVKEAEAFHWEIGIDRRQVVGAFYQAFRAFVESPEYRPTDYEEMRLGDELAQRSGFSEEELIGQLLVVDRAFGERHLQRIRPDGWLFVDDINDPDTRFAATMAALRAQENGVIPLREPTLHTFDYLHPLWDRWDRQRRRAYLQDMFAGTSSGGPFGANLRALRSDIVENYLGWRREPRPQRYVPPPRAPLPDWYKRFQTGSGAPEAAQV